MIGINPINNDTVNTGSFYFLLIFSLLIGIGSVSAQNTASLTAERPMREVKDLARNAYRMGDTYTALFYYQEWAKRKPEKLKVTFRVAELLRETRNYPQAEEWYGKLAKDHSGRYPLSVFYMGRMQMSQEKYKEAKANMLKFKKMARGLTNPIYKKLVNADLEGIEYAISLKDSTKQAVVKHLGSSVNQAHVEFSPIPVDENTLIYGSLKDNGVNYYDVAKHDSMTIPLRKFYVAKKEGDEWVTEGELQGPFNKDNMHVGNGVLSEDGERFYFTICRKNWQNKVICHLYYSKKKNDQWGEPINLGEEINLPNYTTTQPAVGRESRKNAEVIYFVSDRPKSKGGLDIWYTEYYKKKDRFKTPRNAGSKVNSAGTEFTPYYDLSTHTLYFSSDGRGSIGGLDVYKVEGEKSRWSEAATPMQYDINSPADDMGFAFSKDHKTGFLVSNRKGSIALLNETCCDDIYSFRLVTSIDINAKGTVMDSLDCLEDYEMHVYIKDKETGDKYLSEKKKMANCDFDLALQPGYDYYLEVRKDGYFNSGKDISTRDVKESTTIETSLNIKKIPKEPMVLTGILYEYNSSELTAEARASLDTSLLVILNENPEIIVQIAAHTDSKGSDDYNLKLSKKRAASVVKYLISKGVNEKRLQAEGYGESKPIAPNEHPDGSDNPEGRTLNRRTEFEIIGKLDLDDIDDDEE